jgi:hypothetical protein
MNEGMLPAGDQDEKAEGEHERDDLDEKQEHGADIEPSSTSSTSDGTPILRTCSSTRDRGSDSDSQSF